MGRRYEDEGIQLCPMKNYHNSQIVDRNKSLLLLQRTQILHQLESINIKIKVLEKELNLDFQTNSLLRNLKESGLVYRQDICSSNAYIELRKAQNTTSRTIDILSKYSLKNPLRARCGLQKVTSSSNSSLETKLSMRGELLAKELFAKFAGGKNIQGVENSYFMSFLDFRKYLFYIGRPFELKKITTADGVEAWEKFLAMTQSYVKKGDAIKPRGFLLQEGFVTYRNSIENEFPLEHDLVKLEHDLLQADLMKWIAVGQLFEMECIRVFEEDDFQTNNFVHKYESNITNINLIRDYTKVFTARWLQLTLSKFDEFYTQSQILCTWQRHTSFLVVLKELRIKNWWRSNDTNQSTLMEKITSKNMPLHRKETFMAWFMSGRYRPHLRFLEKLAVSTKVKLINGFASICGRIRNMKILLDNTLKKDVIDIANLRELKDKMVDFEVNFNIGDCLSKKNKNSKSQCNIDIKYERIEKIKSFLRKMEMPTKRVGTAIIIDMHLHPDLPKSSRLRLLELGKIIIADNFEHGLQSLRHFHSWKLSLVSESNDVEGFNHKTKRFLRFGLMFNSLTTIDEMLERMFGLDDHDKPLISISSLLNKFEMKMTCSLRLSNIILGREIVLNRDMHIKGSFVLVFAKDIVVKLVSKMIEELEEEFTFNTENIRKWSSLRHESTLRTLEQNPLIPLDVIGTILQAMNYDENLNLDNGKNKYLVIKESNKKKRDIRFLRRIVELMDCLQNCYLDIGLPSNASDCTKLSEIIGGNKLMKLLLPESISVKENYAVQGSIYRRFENFIDSIIEDIKYISNEIDYNLDFIHNGKSMNHATQHFEQDGNTKRQERKKHDGNHQNENNETSGMIETLHHQKQKQEKKNMHSHNDVDSLGRNTKSSKPNEYLEFLSLMKKSFPGCDGTKVQILNGTNLMVLNLDKFIDLAQVIIPNNNPK